MTFNSIQAKWTYHQNGKMVQKFGILEMEQYPETKEIESRYGFGGNQIKKETGNIWKGTMKVIITPIKNVKSAAILFAAMKTNPNDLDKSNAKELIFDVQMVINKEYKKI